MPMQYKDEYGELIHRCCRQLPTSIIPVFRGKNEYTTRVWKDYIHFPESKISVRLKGDSSQVISDMLWLRRQSDVARQLKLGYFPTDNPEYVVTIWLDPKRICFNLMDASLEKRVDYFIYDLPEEKEDYNPHRYLRPLWAKLGRTCTDGCDW